MRFKLYINGNFNGNTFDPDARDWVLPDRFNNLCGERTEFQLAAYSGDRFEPDQESPRSNTVVFESPPCLRTVRVTFDQFEVYELWDHEDDPREGYMGPVFGFFGAHGSTEATLSFEGSDYPDGWFFSPHSVYSIQRMLDTIGTWQINCMGGGCPPYRSPGANYVTVELGPEDDLTIWAIIYDQDRRIYFDVFNGWHTIRAGETVAGSYTILHRPDWHRNGWDEQFEMTCSVEVLRGP